VTSTTPPFELLGERVHALLRTLPDHEAITDTLDYVMGALHGLVRAANVGFADRPGGFASEYRPFLTEYVLQIAAHRPINTLWLAGFYFNSAIQRIAASFDRIPKLLGVPDKGDAHKRMALVNADDYKDWSDVYLEVNALKHDPEGKAKGRQVTMEVALRAMDQLIRFLETKIPELTARYPLPPR